MREDVVWLCLGMGGKASMETRIVTLEAMNKNLQLWLYGEGGTGGEGCGFPADVGGRLGDGVCELDVHEERRRREVRGV